MRKFLHTITNRLVLIGLIVLLQSTFIILEFVKFTNYHVQIGAACKALSLIVTFHLLYKESNPSLKLAWVIPILLFPLLGGIMYLLFGHVIIPSKMSRNIELTQDAVNEALLQCEEVSPSELAWRDRHVCRQLAYIDRYADAPAWKNTGTTYFKEGEIYWKSLLKDLEAAEKFIFVEYFIIAQGKMWDSILNILKRKAAEGVEVRLMYDDIGSIFRLPMRYVEEIEGYGIKCVAFNRLVPFVALILNNRDHRKIVVIDGKIGYTGGVNLADEYINLEQRFGHWKDIGLRIEGNAVFNMTVMFLQLWNTVRLMDKSYLPYRYVFAEDEIQADGYVQPFGDTPLDNETVGENVYLNMISSATEKLYVYTPYLIADHELMDVLRLAAKRGVDVRIVTPGIPDKKTAYYLTQSGYRMLMDAGIKIYQYTPGFIHAKCVMCDCLTAVVGTINFDYRSFYHHFECGVFLYGTESIKDICEDMEHVFSVSELITEQFFEKKKFKWNILGPILRLFAPLM